MTAAALLDRLDGVRRTGEGRWIARCPAHDDRHPSLLVTEESDGRVGVWCFAGCQTAEVLDATGCKWSDLFPPRRRTGPPARRHRMRLASPADALKVLALEARIVVLMAGDLARGDAISEEDRQRLIAAAARLARAEEACR